MANLQRIIALLEDKTIAQEVGIGNDMARERYQMERVTVSDWHEFLDEIGKYYAWHFQRTMVDSEIPSDMAEGLARQIVEQAYASRGGLEDAVRNAKTGMNGGLAGVLTAIAEYMKNEQEQRYIQHVFDEHVDPLDFDSKVDLMQQYLRKFSSHYPPGTQMKSAAQLAGNCQELVRMHAKMISAMQGKFSLS